MVEPAVATVASCLSTIRPLLRQFSIRGFESTERAGYANARGGRSAQNRSGNRYNEIQSSRQVDLELGNKKVTTTTTVVGATGNRSPASSESDIIAAHSSSPLHHTEHKELPERPSTCRRGNDTDVPLGTIKLKTCIQIRSDAASEHDAYNGGSISPSSPSEKAILRHNNSTRRGTREMRPSSSRQSGCDKKDGKRWREVDDVERDGNSVEESVGRPQQNNGPLGSNPPTGY